MTGPYIINPKPLSSGDILYGVRYQALGREYSFRLSKINEKFNCSTQQVLDAVAYLITNNTAPPDGPLKGMFIRTMTPVEQDEVRNAYKKKQAVQIVEEAPMEFIIGSRLPEDIW